MSIEQYCKDIEKFKVCVENLKNCIIGLQELASDPTDRNHPMFFLYELVETGNELCYVDRVLSRTGIALNLVMEQIQSGKWNDMSSEQKQEWFRNTRESVGLY